MAVEFKDESFVITIETASNPIEDWLGLHEELLWLLQLLDTDTKSMDTPWHTLRLLRQMMPEWKSALKLHPQRDAG